MTFCVTGATKPNAVAPYATADNTIGQSKNGINISGFKTDGKPYITGSPILKSTGAIPNFATSL